MSRIILTQAQEAADKAEIEIGKLFEPGTVIDGFLIDTFPSAGELIKFTESCFMMSHQQGNCITQSTLCTYDIANCWDELLCMPFSDQAIRKFSQKFVDMVRKDIAKFCVDFCVKTGKYDLDEIPPVSSAVVLDKTVPVSYTQDVVRSQVHLAQVFQKTPVITIDGHSNNKRIYIREPAMCYPDQALHRRKKHGFYGWMEFGITVAPTSGIRLYFV